MNLGRLALRAKQQIDRRGGTEALKRDAQQLSSIAKGQGSAGDKAKRAADALRKPGTQEREPKGPDGPGGRPHS